MAHAGLKVDKSFKRQAFVEAATIINKSFTLPANMDVDNVENNMRTIKQRYQELKKVMDLSGVGWNDEKKMFVLEDETFRTFVEIENLSIVLFSMDDKYTEEELERAYDHLRRNEGDARGFVHRRPGMRKRWMNNFL
ncbi:hypothetical protein J5N97_017359 [Dioscorea zingiberensis]|uniref:Myb/SANT-like domain-containing protein n=1 Tax=Dioscorea zingiberensis TaxID=325984 RepID=A0A9D5HG99_9LILI|nr:hypothetical protein J5N97_017359 [Dioscorea zingiberensis]